MEFVQKIWLTSFILNAYLLYTVFDILFKSHVVPVSKFHLAENASTFKRVMFIVADGLRADMFFENPQYHPHFSKLFRSQQDSIVWGISDTKVPTESRPGHVALFAGFYEDPSAIFSGWKQNLIPFDTVFDAADFSLLLGSPDVINIFGEGSSKKMLLESYPSDWQDFLASNSSVLDTWVFEKYQLKLKLRTIPSHDKIILFLHLLGIDNTGHAMKPGSEAYMSNIALVDEIVNQVQNQTKFYFGDDDTLYIFTSDHGMTNLGSHGSGSAAETETPFVIWGRGLKSLNKMNAPMPRLNQVDFAALVSGALNIHFPTNSLGTFPAIWLDSVFEYNVLSSNFRQIRELMTAKKRIVEQRYLPFRAFDKHFDIDQDWTSSINLASNSHHEMASHAIRRSIELTITATKYYERYDQNILLCLTILTFLFWITILVLACSLVFHNKSSQLGFGNYLTWITIFSLILVKGLFSWSVWRTLYLVVPLYLLRILISMWKGCPPVKFTDALRLGLFAIGAVEMVVLSFHSREILTFGLMLNVFWCAKSQKMLGRDSTLVFLLFVFILGVFPLLPPPVAKNDYFMRLGPASVAVGSITFAWKNLLVTNTFDYALIKFQMVMLFAVTFLIHHPDLLITRVVAWTSLPMFALPALVSSGNVVLKLFSIFLSLYVSFALLSLSYESFFMPCLFVVLTYLLKFELDPQCEIRANFYNLQFQDIEESQQFTTMSLRQACRTAWLHVFFIFYSFFGIGNLPSISSFNPTSVRCFVSVFNPFIMMALLFVKIIAPFLLVSSIFRVFTFKTKNVEKIFLIVLILSQGMALHMFLNVKNEGSWLEIGTSISHFVIVQVSTLFLTILQYISGILIRHKPSTNYYLRGRRNE